MDYRTRRGDRFTVAFSQYQTVTMQFPSYTETVGLDLFNEMVGRGDVRALPRKINPTTEN